MRRLLVLLALAACDAPEPAPAAAQTWEVAPPLPAWPLGAVRGRLGRSEAPQPVVRDGLAGATGAPLRLPTPWPVPGGGRARAVLSGTAGGKPAVELVEVDRGRVVWRDTTGCAAPVVGVTERSIVCGDARGVRALDFDGKPSWHEDGAFLAVTGGRIAVAAADGGVTVHDDASGQDTHVALPKGVTADTVLAACAGGELFASTPDGKLVRVAAAHGTPVVASPGSAGARSTPGGSAEVIAWAVTVGTVAGLDACAGATVLVTASGDGGTSLVAIARDTGQVTGRVDGVRGYWPARDGSDRLEISTAAGVASWPRDLAGPPAALDLPVLAELLASRGERRLVRATPLTAALLDRGGVRAYVPIAELGAVLGDDHVLAASWLGVPDSAARRFALPPPWHRRLRVPAIGAPLGVPAPLRDLPPVAPLDEAHAVARGADPGAPAAVALDPGDPQALYALVTGARTTALARLDLAARAWKWARADACAPGEPAQLAVGHAIVACAAGGSVRATGKDGAPRWEWTGDHVDAIAAAADVVLAFEADRLAVLDAGDGHVLGTFASDDGAAVRAAAVDLAGTALLFTYERGRLVARVPRAAFLPAWSLAIGGVVRALEPSGDGVLVELEDGDAYRVDARTAQSAPVAGVGLAWRAEAGAITGDAAGEPIPPAQMPVPPPVIRKPRPLHDSPENPPAIATPWTAPPPGPAAWQLTIYDLGGGLRTRNDYALPPPVAHAARGAVAGSPYLVAYGPGLREALVIDAATGDPLRRVHLPEDAPAQGLFATSVDGKPIAGAVLANPLRVVLF